MGGGYAVPSIYSPSPRGGGGQILHSFLKAADLPHKREITNNPNKTKPPHSVQPAGRHG